MTNLNHWKQRIQERRKKTPFSEYLKEIGSWYPLVLSKDGNKLSRYPITDRVGKLSDVDKFEENRSELVKSGLGYDESISFLDNYKKLFLQVPHARMLARNSENSDYVDDVVNSKDSYLSFMIITDCSNIFYSYILDTCSYCIGCIGPKNKSYCILNKQYEKEEWEILANKIFESMDRDGTLGDFFSPELNPFYFNDTIAGLVGDYKKEDLQAEGYLWREEKIKVDVNESWDIISISDLDDFESFDQQGNWTISPEILKKVIRDENENYYRIVKPEYDFLVKHGLPLPRKHWFERIKYNFGITK